MLRVLPAAAPPILVAVEDEAVDMYTHLLHLAPFDRKQPQPLIIFVPHSLTHSLTHSPTHSLLHFSMVTVRLPLAGEGVSRAVPPLPHPSRCLVPHAKPRPPQPAQRHCMA